MKLAIPLSLRPSIPPSLPSPERIFEDHENLVENLLNWTRDSHNKLMFIERIEKYALFKNPQVTLPMCAHAHIHTRRSSTLFVHWLGEAAVFVRGAAGSRSKALKPAKANNS